jgi:hypothetical protein
VKEAISRNLVDVAHITVVHARLRLTEETKYFHQLLLASFFHPLVCVSIVMHDQVLAMEGTVRLQFYRYERADT